MGGNAAFWHPFTEQQLALSTETWAKEIAALGSSTVPVLIMDEVHVVDSLAILETLAETYPHMWPQNKVLRAKAREACARMHSGFFAMRSEMPMNCRAQGRRLVITDACRKDLDAMEALWQSCFAATGSDKAYLFGDFSITDAFFAPVVLRMHGYQVDLSPVTRIYVENMLNNSAVAEWVAMGQAETAIIEEEEVGE